MDRSLLPGLLAFCLPHSPARPHNPHPSPTPLRCLCAAAAPETHFVPSRSTYSHLLALHHTYSTIPPSFLFCSCSKSSGGGWLAAKPGHNPLIFLHVVTASAAISLFSLHPPCCAGWKPGLQSQAPSQMLQLYFPTCSRGTLAKLPPRQQGLFD